MTGMRQLFAATLLGLPTGAIAAPDAFTYTGAKESQVDHFVSRHGDFQEAIAIRTKTAQAEIHDKYTDYFIVLGGRGTLTVGGAMADKKEISPGEWRTPASTGGKDYVLEPGVLITIPAGTPHWVRLPAGGQVRYVVIKKAE